MELIARGNSSNAADLEVGNLYEYNLNSEDDGDDDEDGENAKTLSVFEGDDTDEGESLLGRRQQQPSSVVEGTSRSVMLPLAMILCLGPSMLLLFAFNFYYRFHHITSFSRPTLPVGGSLPKPNADQSATNLPNQRILMQSFITGLPDTFLNNLEGCWKPCFEASFAERTRENFLDNCIGDWVFVYTVDDYAINSRKIFAGAFARKSILSGTDVMNKTCKHSGADCVLTGTFEGGVYWYLQSNDEYGYKTFGFSTLRTPVLSWSYEYIDIASKSGLSWSMSESPNRQSSVNTIASNDQRYREIVMTNTCSMHLS